MSRPIDETHAPSLRSWVASANQPGSDFPIQNLPFGVFARRGGGQRRVGVAIGDHLLDLGNCADRGQLEGVGAQVQRACRAESLGPLLALGPTGWGTLRTKLSELLRESTPAAARPVSSVIPMTEVTMALPTEIGDYTDFYASIHHATNVGSMFRPDQPLMPNYKWLPVGYHGRASSLVPSGTAIHRPVGQTRPDDQGPPVVGPSRGLDYEMEIGALVGPGNPLGTPIPLASAERHLFGLCLVNDWSARDIQRWEYQPLGPFLGKSFATSVSPWMVTLEALAPFRSPRATRAEGDPAPLDYLDDDRDRTAGGFDVTVEVLLASAAMREAGTAPVRVSLGSMRDLYWTMAQMLAHHASNGCNLRNGDLFASGTISGPTPESRGCLLERTWRGEEPLELPGGETRRFLEDGDEVVLRAWCERAGRVRIGFGECRGVIMPAGSGGSD
ncbi:MAG TPA: fumarylacetoacetase [Gemmatimonadales bacterium]|nr:fumarylacetoacetase [Gemmatimonadales bacterium]